MKKLAERLWVILRSQLKNRNLNINELTLLFVGVKDV